LVDKRAFCKPQHTSAIYADVLQHAPGGLCYSAPAAAHVHVLYQRQQQQHCTPVHVTKHSPQHDNSPERRANLA
jgi:hypothetical protein